MATITSGDLPSSRNDDQPTTIGATQETADETPIRNGTTGADNTMGAESETEPQDEIDGTIENTADDTDPPVTAADTTADADADTAMLDTQQTEAPTVANQSPNRQIEDDDVDEDDDNNDDGDDHDGARNQTDPITPSQQHATDEPPKHDKESDDDSDNDSIVTPERSASKRTITHDFPLSSHSTNHNHRSPRRSAATTPSRSTRTTLQQQFANMIRNTPEREQPIDQDEIAAMIISPVSAPDPRAEFELARMQMTEIKFVVPEVRVWQDVEPVRNYHELHQVPAAHTRVVLSADVLGAKTLGDLSILPTDYSYSEKELLEQQPICDTTKLTTLLRDREYMRTRPLNFADVLTIVFMFAENKFVLAAPRGSLIDPIFHLGAALRQTLKDAAEDGTTVTAFTRKGDLCLLPELFTRKAQYSQYTNGDSIMTMLLDHPDIFRVRNPSTRASRGKPWAKRDYDAGLRARRSMRPSILRPLVFRDLLLKWGLAHLFKALTPQQRLTPGDWKRVLSHAKCCNKALVRIVPNAEDPTDIQKMRIDVTVDASQSLMTDVRRQFTILQATIDGRLQHVKAQNSPSAHRSSRRRTKKRKRRDITATVSQPKAKRPKRSKTSPKRSPKAKAPPPKKAKKKQPKATLTQAKQPMPDHAADTETSPLRSGRKPREMTEIEKTLQEMARSEAAHKLRRERRRGNVGEIEAHRKRLAAKVLKIPLSPEDFIDSDFVRAQFKQTYAEQVVKRAAEAQKALQHMYDAADYEAQYHQGHPPADKCLATLRVACFSHICEMAVFLGQPAQDHAVFRGILPEASPDQLTRLQAKTRTKAYRRFIRCGHIGPGGARQTSFEKAAGWSFKMSPKAPPFATMLQTHQDTKFITELLRQIRHRCREERHAATDANRSLAADFVRRRLADHTRQLDEALARGKNLEQALLTSDEDEEEDDDDSDIEMMPSSPEYLATSTNSHQHVDAPTTPMTTTSKKPRTPRHVSPAEKLTLRRVLSRMDGMEDQMQRAQHILSELRALRPSANQRAHDDAANSEITRELRSRKDTPVKVGNEYRAHVATAQLRGPAQYSLASPTCLDRQHGAFVEVMTSAVTIPRADQTAKELKKFANAEFRRPGKTGKRSKKSSRDQTIEFVQGLSYFFEANPAYRDGLGAGPSFSAFPCVCVFVCTGRALNDFDWMRPRSSPPSTTQSREAELHTAAVRDIRYGSCV